MRKPIIAGNWKMFGSRHANAELLAPMTSREFPGVEVLVFPPSVYLQQVIEVTASSFVGVGAQNVDAHAEGAFTGEISASMVRDLGCTHVLVGHSERRTLFGETNETVALKHAAARNAGLVPVLCVGETLDQRRDNSTMAVIRAQLMAVLEMQDLTDSVIAYEPVWAIGTGETATPEQAAMVHAGIREILAEQDPESDNIRILYGGSVNGGNAAALLAEADIDGALVGGASLKSEEFMKICEKAGAS